MSQKPPYVLIRFERPLLRYATLEEAKRPHDSQRFNIVGGAPVDAVIRGPEGMGWRCGRMSYDQWIRDDLAGRPTKETETPADNDDAA